MNHQPILALFNMPGGAEWILILVVALLVFGRRLPDVARSLGKSIVEFKKGIREVNTDIEDQTRLEASRKQTDSASRETKRLESDAARITDPVTAERATSDRSDRQRDA